MRKKYLLTPGPTTLPQEVLEAQAKPIIHHRTAEFQKIFAEVNQGLKYLFKTQNDIFTLACSGTGAMEAAVTNFLSPGDKTIVVCAGKFGERWVELCQTYNLKAAVLNVEWGKPLEMSEFKRLISANKDAQAVFTTLCETSTATVYDIQAIGEILKDTNALLVVDAISGLGAEDLQTDNWHVDCVVAGSQKGMMLPPGLGFCTVSPKAYKKVETAKLPRYYFDLRKAKKSLDKTDTPFTPSVSLIVALREALSLIKEEGLENILQRHKLLAQATRSALSALGLKIFSQTFCSALTAAYAPKGIDSSQIVKLLRSKYGISIADGQGELKGKLIRIAHLGCIEPFDIIVGISGLELALCELGYQVQLGKGVGAAEEVFLNYLKRKGERDEGSGK